MGSGTKSNTTNGTSIWKIIVGVILAASLAANGFLLWEYQKKQDMAAELETANQTIELFKSDPEQAQQASVEEYIEQVSQVYDLPEDETPSIATVRDNEQLDDQPFFDRAENGDVVLIYPDAELALLYRPSTGQVVNVSTLAIDDQQEALDMQDDQSGSSGLTSEDQ